MLYSDSVEDEDSEIYAMKVDRDNHGAQYLPGMFKKSNDAKQAGQRDEARRKQT